MFIVLQGLKSDVDGSPCGETSQHEMKLDDASPEGTGKLNHQTCQNEGNGVENKQMRPKRKVYKPSWLDDNVLL